MFRRAVAVAVLTAVPALAVAVTAQPAAAICITGPLYPYVGCNPVCSAGDKVLREAGFGPLNCIA